MKKEKIFKVALWIIPIVILLLAIVFPSKSWSYLVNLVLAFVEMFLVLFNLKGKNNSIKVSLVVIICLMLLTWLIPAAYFSSGQYTEQGRVQMGLFDLANYPVTAVSYFGYIAFYFLAIGAFYGVLNSIPAYRTFLDKVANVFKGTEKFALFIIMLVLAVLTSIGGMQLALISLFPMLISIILLMGFDKMVAAFTLVGSTMIGIAGTTYGSSNVSLITQTIGTTLTAEMITKVIILVVGVVLLFLNTLLYIKKQTKNNSVVDNEIKKKSIKVEKSTEKTKSSKKNVKAAEKEEEVIIVKEQPKTKDDNTDLVPNVLGNGKHTIWPFVVGFVILFVIVILAFIPWVDAFGLRAFDDATKAVVEFELFGFPIFGKLFGTMNAFGYWSIIDFTAVLLVIGLLFAIIYKVKFEEMVDGILSGIKKALPLGILVILVYTCLIITTYHPFQLEVYKSFLGELSKFNVGSAFIVSISSMISSILNVEPAYAFQSMLPYLSTVITDNSSYSIIAVLSQSMYGLSMLFAPTSLILMIVLSYLDISYSKWLKSTWKLLLEFFLVIFIILTVMILV